MSDPFERLRNPDTSSIVPDVAALKSRARRIERRRQMVLGTGAMAVAIIAVIGIALGTGPDSNQIALEKREEQRSRTIESPVPELLESDAGSAATTGESVAGGTEAPPPAASTVREGAAPKSSSSAALGSATEQSAPLGATVEIKEATLTRPTQFTLKVCNQSGDVVKRSFGTSQRYDFEVRRGGDVVWRWSQDRMFTQVVGEETWKINECKTWAEEWNGMTSSGPSAPAGEYQAIGVLKTAPELRAKATSFCFISC